MWCKLWRWLLGLETMFLLVVCTSGWSLGTWIYTPLGVVASGWSHHNLWVEPEPSAMCGWSCGTLSHVYCGMGKEVGGVSLTMGLRIDLSY